MDKDAPKHPMAVAMNAIGYDAASLGNHEFNYGVPFLRKFQTQVHHPILGANALDWNTKKPAFEPFIIKRVRVHDCRAHGHHPKPECEVRVGIVGLVTPGCAIWDKANLDGKITFNGIVEQAKLAGGQLGVHAADSNTVDADPHVLKITAAAHQKVRTYVNSVIGTSTTAMSAATSRYEDTSAIDFINYVQAETVKAASGTALPMLSIAAPFNRLAAIPAGDVTVRDIAGLYIYDNTLLGIQFTGAQVRAYLEYSAAYFKQVSGTGPFTADQVTNAVTPTAPNGTPDYNYDIMGGYDAPLAYDIDISKPVGSRISN